LRLRDFLGHNNPVIAKHANAIANIEYLHEFLDLHVLRKKNLSVAMLTSSLDRFFRDHVEELVKVLNIGDRIRVLCDDGFIVAEKISQTQFELIH